MCINPVVLDFSGVQTPGVLDDLFFYEGLLGAHVGPEGVAISLWAPTAQQVCCLLLYTPTWKDAHVHNDAGFLL